jgi:pimeloyl-ACP methyl ester carboxylesterase
VKTFVLIPGGGGSAWSFHRVAPILEQAGHQVIAVDLPGADDTKGIHAYADIVTRAIGDRRHLILVGYSMGAFTAALVAPRVEERLERIVFINAMIPLPGETPGAWWGATGSEEARIRAAEKGGYNVDFDLATYFFHDLPKDLVEAGADHDGPESKIAFTERADFGHWPDVPLCVVIAKDDRFFPRELQGRVARERLGPKVDIKEIEGGHLAVLSQPRAVADVLLAHA